MTVSNIPNSFAVQANLSALNNTQNLLEQTEEQLSTGQSVNSASDNAVVFNEVQGLLQQASSFSNLQDGISTSLSTLGSTSDSISSISQVVQQLQGITSQAQNTTDPSTRAALASQYNSLLPQLDQLANDANFNGNNLLNSASNSLVVNFNSNGTSALTIPGINATSGGLGITAAPNNFATTADINTANAQLASAQTTLNTSANDFGSNATLIQTNQDFTSNMINNLQTAANNLSGADLNEEGANLLALEAQTQLGSVSLGISGKLDQSIVNLFSE